MTAIDVANAIRNQNLDAPAGQIGAAADVSRDRVFELPIDTLGRLDRAGAVRRHHRQGRPGRCRSPTARRVVAASARAGVPLRAMTEPAGSALTASGWRASTTSDDRAASLSGTPADHCHGNAAAPRRRRRHCGGGRDDGRRWIDGAVAAGQHMPAAAPAAARAGGDDGHATAGGDERPRHRRPCRRRAASARRAGSRSAAAGRPPSIVRLRDVARVELGAQNYNQSCTFDGRPSVGLSVYQLPGTNALDVADARARQNGRTEDAVSRRRRLRHRLRHHAVHQRVGRGRVQDAVEAVVAGRPGRADVPAGLEGHDPADDRRAGVASSAPSPSWPRLGFSLNNISLFGLVLAIGIVVDDAIVVLENIERHDGHGAGRPRRPPSRRWKK